MPCVKCDKLRVVHLFTIHIFIYIHSSFRVLSLSPTEASCALMLVTVVRSPGDSCSAQYLSRFLVWNFFFFFFSLARALQKQLAWHICGGPRLKALFFFFFFFYYFHPSPLITFFYFPHPSAPYFIPSLYLLHPSFLLRSLNIFTLFSAY